MAGNYGRMPGMSTFTPSQIKSAVRRLPNLADFCRRHELPERTVYRAKESDSVSSRTTRRLLTEALIAEGLLLVAKPKKAARK